MGDTGENPLAAVWLTTSEREMLARCLELVTWPVGQWAAAAALRRKLVGEDGRREDHGPGCRCESCRYHD